MGAMVWILQTLLETNLNQMTSSRSIVVLTLTMESLKLVLWLQAIFHSRLYNPNTDTDSQTITVAKAHLAYNDGAGTTEASECSGRGLCDDSSGMPMFQRLHWSRLQHSKCISSII